MGIWVMFHFGVLFMGVQPGICKSHILCFLLTCISSCTTNMFPIYLSLTPEQPSLVPGKRRSIPV